MELELHVDFYSQAEASVRLETELSLSDSLRVFGLYLLRLFYDQRKDGTAEALARRLACLPGELSFEEHPALTTSEAAQEQGLAGWPGLVPFRGQSQKRLDCYITNGRFFLTSAGFGLFDRDLPHYMNYSALALYRYLYELHQETRAYRTALRIVAAACADFHLERSITNTNQVDLIAGLIAVVERATQNYAIDFAQQPGC